MNKCITYSVYRIVCSPTGECYIGQTSDTDKRQKQHFNALTKNKHYNIYLQHAFNMHGIQSFYFEVLEQNIPKLAIDAREIDWISRYSKSHKLFNMTKGGQAAAKSGTSCWWDDVFYESITDAALANGISTFSMKARLKHGRTHSHQLASWIRGRVAVEWNGISYPSITEAGRANNKTIDQMRNYLKRGYTCDTDIPLQRLSIRPRR